MALFVVLGVYYSVMVPLFESPDEAYHYPVVKHIADGLGLPVQRPGEETLWEQEASQPPLYYALAAALTGWIDTDDLAEIRRPNPHARIGVALAQDNRNMIVPPPGGRRPWRGAALAVHLARLLSVLMGAGTVWCTYRLAGTIRPSRPAWALVPMALVALNPMFLFVSASVNNDNLVVLLSAVTLLLATRAIAERGSSWRRLLLGVVVGLACLTKLSGLALLPLTSLAFALHHALRLGRSPAPPTAQEFRATVRAWLADSLLLVAPVVLIAGWWYMRNWTLYGEPTGLQAMLDVVGRRTERPTLAEALGEFQGLRMSFWGLFGWFNVLMRPTWIYRVLDGLGILAASGLAYGTWRARGRLGPRTWANLGLLAAWVLVYALSLLRWTSMTMASQGRLLFVALPALSVFLALGLGAWRPPRLGRASAGATLALLGALAVASPFVALRPAYATPPISTRADLPSRAQPLQVTFEDTIALLAYEVAPAGVQPGEEVTVTLYWESLAETDEDLSLFIHVFGLWGQPLGQRDSYTGGGLLPTSQLLPGQMIRDSYRVPIRADATGPVAADIEVGLYRLETMAGLPATDPEGRALGRVVLSRVKIDVPTPEVQPSVTLSADYAGRVRLLGYDLSTSTARPGHTLPLSLYWQVTGTLDEDYTVFIQLLDASGTIAGQGDGPPLGNAYPTSFWAPGDTLVDDHQLEVRESATAGTHTLIVGFYSPTSGQRLPVLDESGTTIGDHVRLADLLVTGMP